MKKILIVAAAAGLMSLAACGGGETNTAADNSEIPANASSYTDSADNDSNVVAANEIESANTTNTADATMTNSH